MSSLAAAQADGFYRPPEWDGRKHGSLSKFAGSKGKNQYEQRGVIRFELPYDAWCEKCGSHVGKGTRFNAQKLHFGHYFTTKIWEFRMSCRSPGCSQTFVIRTDPKKGDFDFVEGARPKKELSEMTEEEAGVEKIVWTGIGARAAEANDFREKMLADPLFALEHEEDGKRVASERRGRLQNLQALRDTRGERDFAANSALRVHMRRRRREEKVLEEESTALGWSKATLLPPSESDTRLAEAELMRTQPIRRAKRYGRSNSAVRRCSSSNTEQHWSPRRRELRSRTRIQLEEALEEPLFKGNGSDRLLTDKAKSLASKRKQARHLRSGRARVVLASDADADEKPVVCARIRVGKKASSCKDARLLNGEGSQTLDAPDPNVGHQAGALVGYSDSDSDSDASST